MKMNALQRREPFLFRNALRLLLIVSFAQVSIISSISAWAQSGNSEPEANPQFQNSFNQNSTQHSGGPLSGDSTQPSSSNASSNGIQIGASVPVKHVKAAPISPLDTRISIRVKEAPLATFLDAISAQAKVNFIITEGLESKKITAFLQHVTVREALQILLEIKGLTYQQIGKSNTYVVTKRSKNAPNLITRVYTLSYIPLVEIGQNAGQAGMNGMNSSMGGMNGGMSGMGNNNSMSSNGMGSSNSSSGSGPLAPNQGGSVVGMGNGTSGGMGGMGGMGVPGMASGGVSSIVSVVQSVLTHAGRVAIDPRTNSLIVTDVPEVFPQVDQLIAELDKKAPQIMIEAQIVEIDSARDNDLGFDWGGPNGELGTFTGGQRDTTFPMVLSGNTGNVSIFNPVDNVMSTLALQGGGMMGGGGASGIGAGIGGTGSTGGTFLGQPAQSGINPLTGLPLLGSSVMTSVLNLSQLTILFKALVSHSEARYLGKPKILTVNNRAALIQVMTDTVISVSQSVAGGGMGITQASVTPIRANLGLTLSVTPQVNKDGYITMLINPSFSDAQSSALSSTANPMLDTTQRMASTLVRVKNGETLVMGGLLHSTESKLIRKVPFLGYIPILGWLFTSETASKQNTDLVIFITPTIIND